MGRTIISMEKANEAIEYLEQSLNLARLMVNEGKDTPKYWGNLYTLSAISDNKKDYASAYTYNEELLPILKKFYEEDAETWKAIYVEKLVSRSFYANLLGKFKEGEQYSLEALKVDSTHHIAYTNLAAALLLQGKIEEAEIIYRQYKNEFKDGMLDDFAEFERLGIIPKDQEADVERIKAMLKE
ncbi:MAG: hypothetical protein Q4D28_09330 [Prevotellaceae bacterium]|nr:hypothetical protein [Prevotellaceae bacterium]